MTNTNHYGLEIDLEAHRERIGFNNSAESEPTHIIPSAYELAVYEATHTPDVSAIDLYAEQLNL